MPIATPTSQTSPLSVTSGTPSGTRRKRALSIPGVKGAPGQEGKRAPKFRKVTRACDFCKEKKWRCDGLLPCSCCTKRNRECGYKAKYRRGNPPAPLAANPSPAVITKSTSAVAGEHASSSAHVIDSGRMRGDTPARLLTDDGPPSLARASPEVESAEIEGQYVGSTSNLSFLHRAWRRLSSQKKALTSRNGLTSDEEELQPMVSAGDRPLVVQSTDQPVIPDRYRAITLVNFYFDVCVVTYRCLYQPSVMAWLGIVLKNAEQNLPLHHTIGHSRAAIVITIFAIATLRQTKIEGVSQSNPYDIPSTFQQSDQLFYTSTALTSAERGLPSLESAQARILQALYLLQSSRMNQAWYVFGNTLPLISALGLHRNFGRNRNAGAPSDGRQGPDYITSQCQKRTFWVAYTIDKYLAVVFGRPRLYHDDDIDQDFPDCVNDEDMTPLGPSTAEPLMDCHVDSLICHAKLAQIIDTISRKVYSFKKLPRSERLSAAKLLGQSLHSWRESLPPHLGTVRPLSLAPLFRRQATALNLAYCHAIMHANRPFLLGNMYASGTENAENIGTSSDELGERVQECVLAAKKALEAVDDMAADSTLLHSLWWTSYVTFCALTVVYVWAIQRRMGGSGYRGIPSSDLGCDFADLMELAERCYGHLAQVTAEDSPSRRYSLILEELRVEARKDTGRNQSTRGGGLVRHDQGGETHAYGDDGVSEMVQDEPPTDNSYLDSVNGGSTTVYLQRGGGGGRGQDDNGMQIPTLFDEWRTTDWLDLDSLAFGPLLNVDDSTLFWMTNPPPL